jgi:hypothetical protein
MVTVHRFNGLRVFFYSNEHPPPHVHVTGGGKEARFVLNCPDGPVSLDRNYGFSRGELKMIQAELNGMIGPLCDQWKAIHG